MRSLTRFAVVAALLLSGAALPAQKPKVLPGPSVSKEARDPFDALYPPELVMEHQNELGLSESERQVLRQAVQQAVPRFTDLQWRLSAETERLASLLQEPVVGERVVLEQVDRVLALERDLKRTQIGLLIRIKNALTPEQQAKLAALRLRKPR